MVTRENLQTLHGARNADKEAHIPELQIGTNDSKLKTATKEDGEWLPVLARPCCWKILPEKYSWECSMQ